MQRKKIRRVEKSSQRMTYVQGNNMIWHEKFLNREFGLRVLSAAILAPIVVISVWFGGVAFLALIIVGMILMFHEWLKIVHPNGNKISELLIASLICVGCVQLSLNQPTWATIFIFASLLVPLLLPSYSGFRIWTVFGLVYALISAVSLISLRSNPNGLHIVIGLLILVWATDIGGYFFGKILGGPKLWTRISPNKTWSGAIGGLAFSVVCTLLASWFVGYQSFGKIAALTILFSCMAQLGDLGESAVKRKFNVKDSGKTIPGHGGLLDRIDGLVAASIAAYVVESVFSFESFLV